MAAAFLFLLAAVFLAAGPVAAQTLLKFQDLGQFGRACCVTADAQGNIFTAAIRFDNQPAVVVTKTNPQTGEFTEFPYVVNGASPTAIGVDAQGNVYVAGSAGAASFPLINPVVSSFPITGGTGFLMKYDPSGTRLLFSTLLGGKNGISIVSAIAVDPAGNVDLTGSTGASDFPVTPDAFQTSPPPMGTEGQPAYAFFSRIGANQRLLYSTFLGDASSNCIGGSSCIGVVGISAGNAIAVASDGSVAIAGETNSPKFPVTAGVFQGTNSSPGGRGFVTVFGPDQSVRFSTFLGGSGSASVTRMGDAIRYVMFAPDGSLAVAGATARTGFPITGKAFQPTFPSKLLGGPSLFIARLDAKGAALLASTYFGGSVSENITGMSVDAQSNVWISGVTRSADLPLFPGSLSIGSNFVVGLGPELTSLIQSQLLPAGVVDQAFILDASGNQAMLGSTGQLLRTTSAGVNDTTVAGQASAAGYSVSGTVAPGEVISFYGAALGPISGQVASFDSTGHLQTSVAGTQVLFDYAPVPMLYAGGTQVNAIAPFNLEGKTSVMVQVITAHGQSETFNLKVVPAAPQIVSTVDVGGFHYAVALNGDGTVNSQANPVRSNGYIILWVFGSGVFAGEEDGGLAGATLLYPKQSVSATVNNTALPVSYAGSAPGLVNGVMQVNLQVPDTKTVATLPISITVGTASSPYVYIFAAP